MRYPCLLLVLGLQGLASCTAAPGERGRADDDATEVADQALSAADFDAAVRHLTALPYLPWSYTADGCYARALYYSMLLATKGIPTNHIYAVAQAWTTLGGEWTWHVAPMVTRDGDGSRLYVLDPVLDGTRALTQLEWVARQGHPNPSVATFPILHVHPGNSYLDQFSIRRKVELPSQPDAPRYMEPSFEAMPPFAMTDINDACVILQRHIDSESGLTDAERTEKHTALGRETRRIVDALARRKKVAGELALDPRCTP